MKRSPLKSSAFSSIAAAEHGVARLHVDIQIIRVPFFRAAAASGGRTRSVGDEVVFHGHHRKIVCKIIIQIEPAPAHADIVDGCDCFSAPRACRRTASAARDRSRCRADFENPFHPFSRIAPGIAAIEIIAGPAQAARIHVHGWLAIDVNIIFDHIVAATADERAAPTFVNDIPVNGECRGEVVEINRDNPVQSVAFQMMEIIVADDVAAPGPVATGVQCARITGFLHHIVHVIVFDNVIIARYIKCFVRCIVDQIVRSVIAHATYINRPLVGAHPVAEMVNVIVDRVIARRRQRLPVAAVEQNTAECYIVNIAAPDAVLPAILESDGEVAEIAKGAACDFIPAAARNQHTAAQRVFECQIFHVHMWRQSCI